MRNRFLWASLTLLLFALYLHRTVYIGVEDFEAYHHAAVRWWAGEPLYIHEATPFKYLPGALTFFLPFAAVPIHTGKILFFFVSFAAAAGFYWQTAKLHSSAVALITLILALRFHNADFNSAQVNALLLGLWALLVFVLRKRHSSQAAALLGVIASFKVLPLLAFGAHVLRRQWPALCVGGATFVVFNALPLMHTPGGVGALSDWYHLLQSTTPTPAPADAIIQSIPAALFFVCRTLQIPHLFFVLNALVSAVFLSTLAWLSLRTLRQRAPASLLHLMELALGVTVVFSPLAWKHGYVLLSPLIVRIVSRVERKVAALHATGLLILPTLLALIWGGEVSDRSYFTLLGACGVLLHAASLRDRKDAPWA